MKKNLIPSPFSLRTLLVSTLLLTAQAVQAEVDPQLAFALQGVWQQESPSVSIISSTFTEKKDKNDLHFKATSKDSPTYITRDDENNFIEYSRKRFSASSSPWGTFPQLDLAASQLLEMNIQRKRYLVLSGPGKGLFSVGDWQRFGFLHVLDVSARYAPIHYPLVAEAGLGARVLGRLPDSPVLNYARLVPSSWASPVEPSAYEVSLYALKPKGPERVISNGKPLTYALSRTGSTWVLKPTHQTPVTDARDKIGRAFSAPLLPIRSNTSTANVAPSDQDQSVQ